jgi:flagellar biosynthesis GTPase FlhF
MRRLPPNNRIHSDAAHVTHAIWTDTIGSVSPRSSSDGRSHTRSVGSGQIRKIDHNTSARCKKCGAAGHFAFQCLNDTQVVADNTLNTLIPEPIALSTSGGVHELQFGSIQLASKKRKHRDESSSSESEHSKSHKHKSRHHHHHKTKQHKKSKEKKHKKHKQKTEDTRPEHSKENEKEEESKTEEKGNEEVIQSKEPKVTDEQRGNGSRADGQQSAHSSQNTSEKNAALGGENAAQPQGAHSVSVSLATSDMTSDTVSVNTPRASSPPSLPEASSSNNTTSTT